MIIKSQIPAYILHMHIQILLCLCGLNILNDKLLLYIHIYILLYEFEIMFQEFEFFIEVLLFHVMFE